MAPFEMAEKNVSKMKIKYKTYILLVLVLEPQLVDESNCIFPCCIPVLVDLLEEVFSSFTISDILAIVFCWS